LVNVDANKVLEQMAADLATAVKDKAVYQTQANQLAQEREQLKSELEEAKKEIEEVRELLDSMQGGEG